MKRIVAVILMAIMLLCGCQKVEKQPVAVNESVVVGDPAYGGEISIYSFQQDTFNPLLTQIKANYDVLNLIFEPVVKNNTDGTTEGVLAASWSKSEDGKTYTLEVREGVTFHDGTALTAQDITTSILTAASPESPFYSSLNVVDTVKAQNGKVSVSLISPVSNFISLLEIPVVKSDSANKIDGYTPVGTGPYVYAGSKKNKTYTLSANEKWWQGKAYISKINVNILPDKETVPYSYDAANIDVFTTDVITAGKYAGDGQSRVTYYNEDYLVFLGFNNLSIAFATPEARKAVASAINKNKINEETVFSNYTVTDFPVNPLKNIYSEEVEISLDSSSAHQSEIEPFEVLVCSTSLINSRIGEAIVKQLTDSGFKATLVSLSEEEYTARIAARQYDSFVGSFAVAANNDLNNLLGAGNYFNYNSEAMNGYLASLPLAANDDIAKGIYANIQTLYGTDLPFVSLFYEKKALVVRNTIGGNITPTQGFVYNGVENWYTEVK